MTATKLKAVLTRKGITQAELARRTGIDVYRVSVYVNQGANPTPATLAKFAKALDVNPSDLVEVTP